MKITPNLWFDTQAEEAANYYVSIFKNSKINNITRYTEVVSEVAQMPVGTVLTVSFTLDGNDFVALNGGPVFHFTEAISFIIECKDQAEIDHFWSKLSAGGEEQPCGWLKDKFGVSWQVVPEGVEEMLNDPDPARLERVTKAFFQMKKIDLAALEAARAG
jgi:predicted 3-demethylubiquinone-9 3-methyltransferase (glyoxalase superfamily)